MLPAYSMLQRVRESSITCSAALGLTVRCCVLSQSRIICFKIPVCGHTYSCGSKVSLISTTNGSIIVRCRINTLYQNELVPGFFVKGHINCRASWFTFKLQQSPHAPHANNTSHPSISSHESRKKHSTHHSYALDSFAICIMCAWVSINAQIYSRTVNMIRHTFIKNRARHTFSQVEATPL